MRASASASALMPRPPRLSLSAARLPVADATQLALDVLAWVVVVLLLVVLCKLHRMYRRRRGYREITQDDHALYSQSLMGTKDSWETIPLASDSKV